MECSSVQGQVVTFSFGPSGTLAQAFIELHRVQLS